MNDIVIIGSGLAGYNVARELRKLDRETPLTVITADGGEFYSKPLISNALASNKAPQALPMGSAEEMARQLNATVRARTRVTAIDTGKRVVRIGGGAAPYGRLVLALGAGQIRLPLAGSGAADVLTVNSLDDYARFHAAIAGKQRIAIIGAGLIGCEFANDLAVTGRTVHVIDIAGQPLPRLLPAEGARMLCDKLAGLGVRWHFGTGVKSVDGADGGLRLDLDNGESLEADVVLSAIGLRPNVALAREAGITVNRGIVVDRWLRTSAEDVYALGDCAEVEGLVLPFVMPIMHAARALAAGLAGKPVPLSYPAMPVLVKTPACPTIVAPPANGAAGQWEISRTGDGVTALFVDGAGGLLGFALSGAATAERAKLAKLLPPVLA